MGEVRDVLLVRGIGDGRDVAVVKRSVLDGAEGEGACDADGTYGIKAVCILNAEEYCVVVLLQHLLLLLLLLPVQLLSKRYVLGNVRH